MILRARFVAPIDAPVLENAAVRIEDDLIAEVELSSNLSGPDTIDYGDAVILPGFINAHTHLELGYLAGKIPTDGSLTDWLGRLMKKWVDDPPTRERVQAAVREGIAESLSHGVTAIGDITRNPRWTREELAAAPLRTISFGEVAAIGTRRSLLDERLDAASEPGAPRPRPDRASPVSGARRDFRFTSARATGPPWSGAISEPRAPATDTARIGISPHSPYTLEPDGFRACAKRADQRGLPLAIHVLESADEDAFTRRLAGPLVDFLKGVGVWDDRIPMSDCGPIELLERTGVLGRNTLLVHVNYADDEDIARIARSGSSVAYCPRTHAAFGHLPHRFLDMLNAGINVCIGTDSLASNPSLSVLDELRFLHGRFPEVSLSTLLAMGTLRGARALGLEMILGSIRPGKRANLTIVPLDSAGACPAWSSILDSSSPPIEVFVGGFPRSKTTTLQ